MVYIKIMKINKETRASEENKISSYTERKIYVQHKLHGTCITYEAQVYVPCVEIPLDKKVSHKWKFGVTKTGLIDPNGNTWVKVGENPGCGPRLPKSLKETHGKEFFQMTHAERKEFLQKLTPTQ
jgi:hypothetical protein